MCTLYSVQMSSLKAMATSSVRWRLEEDKAIFRNMDSGEHLIIKHVHNVIAMEYN